MSILAREFEIGWLNWTTGGCVLVKGTFGFGSTEVYFFSAGLEGTDTYYFFGAILCWLVVYYDFSDFSWGFWDGGFGKRLVVWFAFENNPVTSALLSVLVVPKFWPNKLETWVELWLG